MTAIEVIIELVRVQPEIKCLNLDMYSPSLNVKELPRKLYSVRLLSHYPSEIYGTWERENLTKENIEEALLFLTKDEVIAVRSDITRVVGETRGYYHIPMMDFADRKSVRKIEDFLSAIGRSNGVILSSGRSYHYYGLGLLNEREWHDFLADCLLSELADVRYIGHRLRDGCGVLRISACPLRPKIPTVVSIL